MTHNLIVTTTDNGITIHLMEMGGIERLLASCIYEKDEEISIKITGILEHYGWAKLVLASMYGMLDNKKIKYVQTKVDKDVEQKTYINFIEQIGFKRTIKSYFGEPILYINIPNNKGTCFTQSIFREYILENNPKINGNVVTYKVRKAVLDLLNNDILRQVEKFHK